MHLTIADRCADGQLAARIRCRHICVSCTLGNSALILLYSGAIILHGPHHFAVKSSTDSLSDDRVLFQSWFVVVSEALENVCTCCKGLLDVCVGAQLNDFLSSCSEQYYLGCFIVSSKLNNARWRQSVSGLPLRSHLCSRAPAAEGNIASS